jgi:stage II sporulation protein M
MPLILFYKELLTINWIWIRKTLYWTLAWLILGCLFALLYPPGARAILDILIKIFQQILHGGEATRSLATAWLIFCQNLRTVLIMLFLGIILGLIPRLSTAVNAFIIGVIFIVIIKKSILSVLIFILVLIPHGIFEIPAILLGAAFGLRFGLFWKIPGDLTTKQKFVLALKQNVQLVPLLVLLLAIASVVEVFVSGSVSQAFASYVKIVPRG